MHTATSSSPHDPAPPATGVERRQHKRATVKWSARVQTAEGYYDCMVRNLSCSGAKLAIIAAVAPEQVIRLVIDRGGTLRATVVWTRYGAIGVRFLEPPDLIASAIRRRAAHGRA
jgi:hypothetical protein